MERVNRLIHAQSHQLQNFRKDITPGKHDSFDALANQLIGACARICQENKVEISSGKFLCDFSEIVKNYMRGDLYEDKGKKVNNLRENGTEIQKAIIKQLDSHIQFTDKSKIVLRHDGTYSNILTFRKTTSFKRILEFIESPAFKEKVIEVSQTVNLFTQEALKKETKKPPTEIKLPKQEELKQETLREEAIANKAVSKAMSEIISDKKMPEWPHNSGNYVADYRTYCFRCPEEYPTSYAPEASLKILSENQESIDNRIKKSTRLITTLPKEFVIIFLQYTENNPQSIPTIGKTRNKKLLEVLKYESAKEISSKWSDYGFRTEEEYIQLLESPVQEVLSQISHKTTIPMIWKLDKGDKLYHPIKSVDDMPWVTVTAVNGCELRDVNELTPEELGSIGRCAASWTKLELESDNPGLPVCIIPVGLGAFLPRDHPQLEEIKNTIYTNMAKSIFDVLSKNKEKMIYFAFPPNTYKEIVERVKYLTKDYDLIDRMILYPKDAFAAAQITGVTVSSGADPDWFTKCYKLNDKKVRKPGQCWKENNLFDPTSDEGIALRSGGKYEIASITGETKIISVY